MRIQITAAALGLALVIGLAAVEPPQFTTCIRSRVPAIDAPEPQYVALSDAVDVVILEAWEPERIARLRNHGLRIYLYRSPNAVAGGSGALFQPGDALPVTVHVDGAEIGYRTYPAVVAVADSRDENTPEAQAERLRTWASEHRWDLPDGLFFDDFNPHPWLQGPGSGGWEKWTAYPEGWGLDDDLAWADGLSEFTWHARDLVGSRDIVVNPGNAGNLRHGGRVILDWIHDQAQTVVMNESGDLRGGDLRPRSAESLFERLGDRRTLRSRQLWIQYLNSETILDQHGRWTCHFLARAGIGPESLPWSDHMMGILAIGESTAIEREAQIAAHPLWSREREIIRQWGDDLGVDFPVDHTGEITLHFEAGDIFVPLDNPHAWRDPSGITEERSVPPPPRLETIPDADLVRGRPHRFEPSVVDGAPPLAFELVWWGSGMEINGETGLVTWLNPIPVGERVHQIRVTDALGRSDETTWRTAVAAPEIPPDIKAALDAIHLAQDALEAAEAALSRRETSVWFSDSLVWPLEP